MTTATDAAIVRDLVPILDRVKESTHEAPSDGPTWGLHARVDRAVSDYIGQIGGGDPQAAGVPELDPYTYLIVRATLMRRYRLNPVTVMAYSRPFCPPFEAIEDALLKPLSAIAHSDETQEMRNYRVQALLADWIPEITQDLDAVIRGINVEDIG